MSVTLLIIIILTLAVVFVNGWTDAPNAIATVVSTRVLSPSASVKMAVVMNFLGTLTMTMISAEVAETMSNIVRFGPHENESALVVLSAAMCAIVVWAVAAWFFGIPTSESHALIAGVSGGAIALGGYAAINGAEWSKVLIGLGISSVLGFITGYLSSKLVRLLFRRSRRSAANKVFNFGGVFAAGMMAFMHGAQDGQKFMGTFLLGLYLYDPLLVSRTAEGTFQIPIWLMVVCSLVMGLGTSLGGYRIIKTVGMDMCKLEKYQGFAADISASACLLLSSLTGVPVSTTHTKTTAIMGVGASKRLTAVNWSVAREMVVAWVLTFPGCGFIAFLMAKLFLRIF